MSWISFLAFLIVVLLLLSFLWGFLYFTNNKFRKWADKRYVFITSFLKKNGIKDTVKIFVHGGFHSVILLVSFLLVILLLCTTYGSNSPKPQNINMVFTRNIANYNPARDLANDVEIKYIFDSDSLYEESNHKGRSGIKIQYRTEKTDTVTNGLVYLTWSEPGKISAYRDSILYKDSAKYRIMHDSLKSATLEFNPARDSAYPYDSKRQEITIINDKWSNEKKSPYYYYYLNMYLPEQVSETRNAFLNDSLTNYHIKIIIQIGDIIRNDSIIIHNSKVEMPISNMSSKNLKYNYIHPVPDEVYNGYIVYSSKESLKKFLNYPSQCITIQAEDIDQMKKSNQETLLLTVLLGMLVGFLLDVIIQQIKELRNFNGLQIKDK